MPSARFANPMDDDCVLTCRLVALMVQIGDVASELVAARGSDEEVARCMCVAHSLVTRALQAHVPVPSLDPASA